MVSPLNRLIERLRPKQYVRRSAVVLMNGLAEQPESWYRNRRYLSRYFDVHMPSILVYEGQTIHDRIESGEPISVDYLVEQYRTYLDQFVQNPPYNLVASSLGGKVAVELAARYPKMVARVVLICPSGMGDKEQLPIMDGLRLKNMYGLAKSVFYRARVIDREMVKYYKNRLEDRRWKRGMLRCVKGTLEHVVRDKLKQVKCPTLVITGTEDRICCPKTAEEAARELADGQFVAIPRCGHAPQIEKHWLVNRLIVRFLNGGKPVPTSPT